MGWEEPYLGGALDDDLLRLIGWIDHMAIDQGKPASTVGSYVTGAKQQLLMQLVISEALGRAGEPRHAWVRHAVASVAASDATRVIFPPEWIMEGRSYWPVPVYVAVVFTYMAALRSGELLANYSGGRGEHLLFWENLQFVRVNPDGSRRTLARGELSLAGADALQLQFDSRKMQERGQVRALPPITRLFEPPDNNPRVDLTDMGVEVGLCAVTLLQAWFLWLSDGGPVCEKQPVMQNRNGELLGSRLVITSIRRISTAHGVNPKDVVIHSLKHSALTALGEAGASAVDIAMAGGHKTIESSVPYLHPGLAQGRRNSEALGRKRRVERSDV